MSNKSKYIIIFISVNNGLIYTIIFILIHASINVGEKKFKVKNIMVDIVYTIQYYIFKWSKKEKRK